MACFARTEVGVFFFDGLSSTLGGSSFANLCGSQCSASLEDSRPLLRDDDDSPEVVRDPMAGARTSGGIARAARAGARRPVEFPDDRRFFACGSPRWAFGVKDGSRAFALPFPLGSFGLSSGSSVSVSSMMSLGSTSRRAWSSATKPVGQRRARGSHKSMQHTSGFDRGRKDAGELRNVVFGRHPMRGVEVFGAPAVEFDRGRGQPSRV